MSNITKQELIDGFKKMRDGFNETLINLDAVEIPGRESEYGVGSTKPLKMSLL